MIKIENSSFFSILLLLLAFKGLFCFCLVLKTFISSLIVNLTINDIESINKKVVICFLK